MKKQAGGALDLAVDRDPRQAETRRKARDVYLNERGLAASDDKAIYQEIGKHINHAKLLRGRAGKLSDKENENCPIKRILSISQMPWRCSCSPPNLNLVNQSLSDSVLEKVLRSDRTQRSYTSS